jgi:hypothetical protein
MKSQVRVLVAIVSLVASGMLFATQAHASNLVVNGGFETGDFTGWTLGPDTGFFGVESGPLPTHSGNYGVYIGAVESLGSFDANINAGNQLSQILNTNPADTYTLDFWLDNWAGGSDGFEALWNGSVITGSVLDNANAFGWTEFTFSGLAANSTATTLQFNGFQNPSYFGLDDVAVTATGVTATPEPGSLLLMGTGILGLAVFLIRKAKPAINLTSL